MHDGILFHTPHTFHHSHVLIHSLNIGSLSLHKNDVLFDYNPKTSHILCLNEPHFRQQTYAQNDTMIIYDKSTIQPNELKIYSIQFQFKEIMIIIAPVLITCG